MADFLLAASGFVLAMMAIGLIRVLHGPADVDRMMAAQLFGTGGIAVVLLMAAATDVTSLVDVALVLSLLAAFAGFAFVLGGAQPDMQPDMPRSGSGGRS
jgi:multicomponent Na+:H+ antiporter subunit F